MNEHEFIKTLEQRAKEQEKIIKGMILPGMFAGISSWLGEHPWKILIPIAFIFTLILRSLFEKTYDEFILKIFGKL